MVPSRESIPPTQPKSNSEEEVTVRIIFVFFLEQAHQNQIAALETEYSSKEMKLQEQVINFFYTFSDVSNWLFNQSS